MAGRRWLRRVVVGLACLGGLAAVGAAVFWPSLVRLDERMNGVFRQEDYAWVRSRTGPRLSFMPARLPPSARDVRILATDLGFNLLPPQDTYVSVSFTVDQADAAALSAAATSGAEALVERLGAEKLKSLPTPGDPPDGQKRWRLSAGAGFNGMVTLDPVTGRVEYVYSEY